MPIYQYECPECGMRTERIRQDYDNPEPPHCPQGLKENEECGEPASSRVVVFDRVIGSPNAHFKGSGFHTTDYDDAENPASKNNN